MSFGHFDRAHLDEAHADSAACELVGGFAACEACADDGYVRFIHGVDGAKGDRGVFWGLCKRPLPIIAYAAGGIDTVAGGGPLHQ